MALTHPVRVYVVLGDRPVIVRYIPALDPVCAAA